MLSVNEIFGPTIQGEGKSAGKPCIFIRLAYCNLDCVWCDTKHSWDWKNFSKAKEVHKLSVEQIVSTLQLLAEDVKAVVITGGEPLLQQEKLIVLILKLKYLGYWVEIETNGTIVPQACLLDFVDQINCSPKFSNSKVEVYKREVPAALLLFSNSKKTNFKFVISNQQDSWEIVELVRKYNLKQVYLMPEGKTAKELQLHEGIVRSLCATYGFSFSPRLHITKLGGGRGV